MRYGKASINTPQTSGLPQPRISPLESMPLPPGYFWCSLPNDDRFAAVLCYGERPVVKETVACCRDEIDALNAIEVHRRLMR